VRILITGGAGCLGSNLIERYLPAGHEVLAIDNFATGRREVLPSVPGLTLVEGSIADAALVDRCFDDFDPSHVIHAAAAYKDPSDWREDAATNVSGAINVAAAAARHDVRRLVYLQTALCYGRPDQVPIPVDHPARPFTSYGISKLAGERYVLMADIPVVSLRLANITGPRLAIGPIPTFYRRLKAGQGCFCADTVRDFLDMEDFFSIMDIVPAVVLDPSRTREVLGWEARIGFTETIDRMLRWYDAHGVSDIHSHLAAPDGAPGAGAGRS